MKVYTVMLNYKESEVLVLATASYDHALYTYHKQIDLIDEGVYTNAIGVRLHEWENNRVILLREI